MKIKILASIFLICFSLISIEGIYAKSSKEVLDSTSSANLKTQKTDIKSLQNEATRRIDMRINSLKDLLKKLENQKIEENKKSNLKSEIYNKISKIKNIENQINLNQNEALVKADFEKILSEKIYEYYIPKVKMLFIIEELIAVVESYDSVYQKIHVYKNSLPEENQKNDKAQVKLNRIKQEISEIYIILNQNKTRLNDSKLMSHKELFQEISKDIKVINKNFAEVNSDFKLILIDIKP